MISLDSIPELSKIDSKGLLSSIASLPDQFKQVVEEVEKLELPMDYSLCKNVVICGMGGSALAGRIINDLVEDTARAPIEISTEFDPPSYLGPDTLAIIYSYSGDTEETVSALNKAILKRAKIVVVTTGGKLEEIALKDNLPLYKINPTHNPSNQPRMSLGYSVGAMLMILGKTGFLGVSITDLDHLTGNIREFVQKYSERVGEEENLAKKMARRIYGHIPVLVTSSHLKGVLHAVKNQINENSKNFAVIFDIPELNHHLLEGLSFPASTKRSLHFLIFYSKRFPYEVEKRYEITKEVIEKNGVTVDILEIDAESKLDEVFKLLVFGSYLGFYLAILNQIDPGPIPWVDYFKEKLKS